MRRVPAYISLAICAATPLFSQVPPPQRVIVSPVVERDLPASMRLVGTVLAHKRAVVAAEIAGMVQSYPASEGTFLKAGQIICQLDPKPAQLRLDEAKGRLDSLKARLEELENGTRSEVLRQLEAAVGEAQAQYDLWKFEKERIERLAEQNQSNPKEVHDANMQFLAAERRLGQAKARHDEAVNGPRKETIDQARADVAAQEAIVRRLARDVEKTSIRAPFDGFLVSKRTEVGEWIETGGPVCEMVAIETVKVRADVPERAIAFARVGKQARVEVEALRRSFEAKISRVIPLAAEAARTFPVEIDLPNSEHTLLPGMFVWTYVPAGPEGTRLMVSKDAIVPEGTAKRIYVVRSSPGGGGASPSPASAPSGYMAVPVPVETGLEVAGDVEIRAEGVRAGDLAVVRANERLYGPTPVIPTPASESDLAETPQASEGGSASAARDGDGGAN